MSKYFVSQIDRNGFLQTAENRNKLKSVVSTVICGRQEIGLRGKIDYEDIQQDETVNHGNFRALLRFRVGVGDDVLKQYL